MSTERKVVYAGALPAEHIAGRILLIRGHKVLLDADLAALYGVPTKALVQAVKRNLERFPEDFMLQLSDFEEFASLRSQSVISKPGRGGRRYAPYAFTEQGVAMLTSVPIVSGAAAGGSARSGLCRRPEAGRRRRGWR